MKALVCFASLFFVSSAIAEPMHFEINGTGGDCCRWIQATGAITQDTPAVFEGFLRSSKFTPGIVRLDSGGGSAGAGVALGEIFRARGFATEVGSSKINPESVQSLAVKTATPKRPGVADQRVLSRFLAELSEHSIPIRGSDFIDLISATPGPNQQETMPKKLLPHCSSTLSIWELMLA